MVSIFTLLIIFSSSNESYSLTQLCQWENAENFNSLDIRGKEYYLLKSCSFTEKVDLHQKLINLDFITQENEIIFSLIDSEGNEVTTFPIYDGYNISTKKYATIVLDPHDFTNKENQSKNFEINEVIELRLYALSESFDSNVSDPNFTTLTDYPIYDLTDNLPVSSPLPAFLFLVFVSFPAGFVLLRLVGFMKEKNFLIKLPWMFTLGFIIYLLFSFIMGIFWISFETILIYIIMEYAIFTFYLIKIKNSLSIKKTSISKTNIFFLSIFIISGFVAISYSQVTGWLTGIHDDVAHVYFVSLTTATNSYPLLTEESFLPIRDIPFDSLSYPKASHMSAAGLSLFLGIFPAVSLNSIFSFSIFLLPILLASLVYKYTNSIFYSSLMFVFSYWRPEITSVPIHWNGDMMLYNIVKGHFAGQVGLLILLVFFILYLEFFNKNSSKIRLFILSSVVFFVLVLTYQAFLLIPVLISIFGFLVYYIKEKRNFLKIITGLVILFVTFPLWNKLFLINTKYSFLLEDPIFRYFKYIEHPPWNIYDGLFPFWVSGIISLIGAIYLVKNSKYRYLSIIFIIFSLIQLFSLSEDITINYLFFHQSMRSIGLWFLLSVSFNLILAHYILKEILQKHPSLQFKKLGDLHRKIFVFGFILILLLPSGLTWLEVLNYPLNPIRVPGGNERNLQYWLYEKTNQDDLILNDLSFVTQWFLGFRAQKMVNFHQMEHVLRDYCNVKIRPIEDWKDACIELYKLNEILVKPWDYDYLEETLTKYNVKYLYISERHNRDLMICDICLSNHQEWASWKYSDNARIAMYENHPNLELILRNGGSAIFKVV